MECRKQRKNPIAIKSWKVRAFYAESYRKKSAEQRVLMFSDVFACSHHEDRYLASSQDLITFENKTT